MKAIFRSNRTRAKLHGTAERPRLSVNISNKHVIAQLIDDDKGTTLVYATTVGSKLTGTKTELCAKIGSELGKKAKPPKSPRPCLTVVPNFTLAACPLSLTPPAKKDWSFNYARI